MPDINKHEVDIENLFKQNELDLNNIKELYKRIEELGEKISQIKVIDSTLAKKLKKEYEKLKKQITDENVIIQLDNKIDETKVQINNNIDEINSQLVTITNRDKNYYYNDYLEKCEDETSALENMINDVYEFASSVNFEGFTMNLIFNGGNYNITSPIKISPLFKICCIGEVKFIDKTDNTSPFLTIEPYSDEPIYKQYYKTSSIFNTSKGTLEIINDDTRQGVGIYIGGTSTHGIQPCIDGISIKYYDIGLKIGNNNIYMAEFNRLFIGACNIGIQFGENGQTKGEMGENISFNNSILSGCKCCIRSFLSIDFKVYNTSMDYSYCIMYLDKALTVNIDKCWIEGWGHITSDLQNWGNFNEFSGIAYSPSAYTNIIIRDTKMYYDCKGDWKTNFKSLMFDGVMKLSIIDCDITNSYGNYNMAKGLNNIYSISDTVNIKEIKNINKISHCTRLQSKLSATNGYLTNATTGEIELTTGTEIGDFIVTSIENTNKIEIIEDGDIKAISITPKWAMNNVVIESKNKYLVKGNSFEVLACLKGYKGASNSLVRIYVDLYDSNDNLIVWGTTSGRNNEFGVLYYEKSQLCPISETASYPNVPTVETDEWVWGITHKDTLDLNNNNAFYYKVKFELIANSGQQNVNPVSFSGLQVVNY